MGSRRAERPPFMHPIAGTRFLNFARETTISPAAREMLSPLASAGLPWPLEPTPPGSALLQGFRCARALPPPALPATSHRKELRLCPTLAPSGALVLASAAVAVPCASLVRPPRQALAARASLFPAPESCCFPDCRPTGRWAAGRWRRPAAGCSFNEAVRQLLGFPADRLLDGPGKR